MLTTCSESERNISFGPLLLRGRYLCQMTLFLTSTYRHQTWQYPDVPIHKFGCRGTGVRHHGVWQHIPEMVPQLVVPDLKDCHLKPYVSYRTKEIHQEPITSKDLFNAVYGPKIVKDFKLGKLDEDGNPLEPNDAEKLTSDEAWIKARKTGSDIMRGGVPFSKKFRVRWEYMWIICTVSDKHMK